MNSKQLLAEARKLIKSPSAWTQRAMARDDEDVPINVLASGAAKFCVMGSLVRAGNTTYEGITSDKAHAVAHSSLVAALGTASITYWNDRPGRTHGEVLEAFDRAIELAK